MPSKNISVFDFSKWHRELRNARRNLRRLYRRRGSMPDPFKMSNPEFYKEWKLISRLCGTIFMPPDLIKRYKRMYAAYSHAVACSAGLPY